MKNLFYSGVHERQSFLYPEISLCDISGYNIKLLRFHAGVCLSVLFQQFVQRNFKIMGDFQKSV